MKTFLNSVEIGAHGQRTLPGDVYLSLEVLAQERERIFSKNWLCMGRASEFSKAGDFRVRQIGAESVIMVLGHDDQIRAHLNVCRHRGTRICTKGQGTFASTIQCPYHAWTYGLDGKLVGVPDESQFDDFCRDDFPLHSVACHIWEGFVWINLASQPEPFETSFAPVLDKFRAWNVDSLVSGGRREYEVKANWKLIAQNYSECYHCAVIHPELTRMTPPKSGGNDLIEGPFLGGFMEVTLPGGSLTESGRACGLSVGTFSSEEIQRAYFYVLFPHLLLSLHHDYVMVHTLWPIEPGLTRIECEWLFHPGSIGTKQWNPDDGISFWDQTNREDWHVSELTQLGVASSRYKPGPYSNREAMSAAFDRQYLRAMQGSTS
jgi:glycine betaine catabolism A